MPEINDFDQFLTDFGGDVVEKYDFYDGKVQLGYDSKAHAYFRWEGMHKILIPGVTSVVAMIDKSGPLTQWAANETVSYVKNKMLSDEKVKIITVDGGVPKRYFDVDDILVWMEEARFNYRTISKTATDVGKMAHEWLETHLKAKAKGYHVVPPLPENEAAKNCVTAGLEWIAKHNYRPIRVERKIYSVEYEFAGTLDNYGIIDGCGVESCCGKYAHRKNVKCIADWKSSKQHYDEYRFQTAAYLEAHAEEFPDERAEIRIIIRLGKEDGKVDPKTYGPESQIADFGAFFHALQLFNRVRVLTAEEKAKRDVVKAALKAEKTAAKEAAKLEKAAAKAAAKKQAAQSAPTVEV